MADKKISALTGATTPLAGTEVLPIVQSGTTVKVSVANLTAGRAMSASSVNISGLTASTALALDASKEVVSVTNTGTGDNVLATSPTLVTPILGVASATSLNKVALTAPATNATLTIAEGKTLTVSNSLTIAGTDATTMTFPTTSATIARTDAANSFTGDQTLSTGNLIVSDGKGIDFSATSGTGTSELFSDYEEGTFTPTITSSSGTITSFTLGVCNYTKVGRMVTVNFSATITDAGTGGGALNVPLPFTNGAANSNGTGRETGLTGSQLQTRVAATGTDMNIQNYVNASVITTSAQIRATMTYFV
jgi:hypothetical protein